MVSHSKKKRCVNVLWLCFTFIVRVERATGCRTTIKHKKDLRQEEMLGVRVEQKLLKLKRH